MANARLLAVSHADSGTVSATSEAIDADNLLDTDVRKVWRSTSTADQKITVDFGSAKSVNALYLGNVNAGRYELQLSNDNFSTVLYAEQFAVFANDLAHKDAILWLAGTTGGDFVVDGNGDFIVDGNGDFVIDQSYSQSLPISVRYLRLIVADASVTDGYYEIGRLKVGQYFDAPNSQNVAANPALDYVERGELMATRSGSFRSENKTSPRRLRVIWQWIHPTDAYGIGGNEFSELLRVTGHRDDVVLALYPGDTDAEKDRLHTVLGRITDRSPIEGTTLIASTAGVRLYSQLSLEVTEGI